MTGGEEAEVGEEGELIPLERLEILLLGMFACLQSCRTCTGLKTEMLFIFYLTNMTVVNECFPVFRETFSSSQDRDVRLSKSMSYALRHGANHMGLQMGSGQHPLATKNKRHFGTLKIITLNSLHRIT